MWIVVLWLAVSVVVSGCGDDGTHSNIPNTAGIVSVFNEVYDGNSTLVNTSSSQDYQQIDFMYIAFVHINNPDYTQNYDPSLPTGALDWENTPHKPSTYAGTGKQWEQSAYCNIYNLAHSKNPDMKFIVSLGWGDGFNDIPTIELNLTTFTNSLIEFITKQHQLGCPIDGFDIDYEVPKFTSNASFQSVSKTIRQALETQGQTDGKHYYFTITPNNKINLDGNTLNTYFDYVNVQSYGYVGDLYCPVSNFISLGVKANKILSGADTQNKGDDYKQAISTFKSDKLAGVFAWIFGCIDNTWSPNYGNVLTPMWNATHPSRHGFFMGEE